MKLQAGKPKAVAGVTDAIGGGRRGPARTNAAARTRIPACQSRRRSPGYEVKAAAEDEWSRWLTQCPCCVRAARVTQTLSAIAAAGERIGSQLFTFHPQQNEERSVTQCISSVMWQLAEERSEDFRNYCQGRLPAPLIYAGVS